MPRRFQHDVPSRIPRARQGRVRARLDSHNYILDIGDGTAQMGYHAGTYLFEPGESVHAEWNSVGPNWFMETRFEPSWFEYEAGGSNIDMPFDSNDYGTDYATVYDSEETTFDFYGGAYFNVYSLWFWDYQGDDWPIVADGTVVKAICEVLEIPDSITLYFKFVHISLDEVIELGRSNTFTGTGRQELVFTLNGDRVTDNPPLWDSVDAFDKKQTLDDTDSWALQLIIQDSDPDEIDGHDVVLQFGNLITFGVDRPMLADNLDEWEGMDGNTWMPGPFVVGDNMCHVTGIGSNLVLYGKDLDDLEAPTSIHYYGMKGLNKWTPLAWLADSNRLFAPSDMTGFEIDGKCYIFAPSLFYDRDTDLWYNKFSIFGWSGTGTKLVELSILDLGLQETGNRAVEPYDWTDYNWGDHYEVKLDNGHIGVAYDWEAFRIESTGLEFPTLTGHVTLEDIKYAEWSLEDGWSEPIVISHLVPVYVGDYNDPFAYTTSSLGVQDVIAAYDDGIWILYNDQLNRVAEFTWFSAYPSQSTIYAVRAKAGIVGTPIQLVQSTIPVSLVLSGGGDLWQWGGQIVSVETKRAGIIYAPVKASTRIDTFVPYQNFNVVTFTDEATPTIGLLHAVIDNPIAPSWPSSPPHVADENHIYFVYTKDLNLTEEGPNILLERDYGSPETILSKFTDPYGVGFNYLTKGLLYNGKLYAFFQLHNGDTQSGWMLDLMEYEV